MSGLAANASLDPQPVVRLQNLLALVRDHPRDPRTAEVLEAACADEADAVRVHAAIAVGARGRDVLREVVGRDDADDASAARALRSLGHDVSPEEIRAILGQALRHRHVEVAKAAIELLARRGDGEGLAVLVKVLRLEQGALSLAAAVAIGETGDPAGEEPLIEALSWVQPALDVAVTRALGKLGTARAVAPLLALEARAESDAGVRGAARQAVAEIQSRLQGAAPGQLSLAGSEAGALSLVQDESGRLSLGPSDPGAGEDPVRPSAERRGEASVAKNRSPRSGPRQ
jgi:HEAT repeat protein